MSKCRPSDTDEVLLLVKCQNRAFRSSDIPLYFGHLEWTPKERGRTMFEGPGTTMTKVNTQFSLLTALFVVRNMLYFEFPAFFQNFSEIQDEKKNRSLFSAKPRKQSLPNFRRAHWNPAIVT